MSTTTFRLALFGLIVSMPVMAADPAPIKVVIRGQGKSLGETPIVVPIKASVEPGAYRLEMSKDQTVKASVFRDGSLSYLAAVLPSLPAEGDISGHLVKTNDVRGLQLLSSTDGVEVTLDSQVFTTYLSKFGPKPYYFPVIGPTGKPITRAYPMKDLDTEKHDHPHQRSMWFTYGNVNGIDFWSEAKGHGSIVETSREVVAGSPTFGEVRSTDDWLGPKGELICVDKRTVRFFATASVRIIDFDITIKATKAPVTFGDTKEGMFGVRVATSMDVDSKQGGKITNSEGLTNQAAWGKAATWVDYTGPVDGETVGIAILNHPSSFRHPTTWHVRTYGLFAANPFGWHDFGMKQSGAYTIPLGESIHFGYRVILHKGDTASAHLADAYASYAKPPTLTIIGE